MRSTFRDVEEGVGSSGISVVSLYDLFINVYHLLLFLCALCTYMFVIV